MGGTGGLSTSVQGPGDTGGQAISATRRKTLLASVGAGAIGFGGCHWWLAHQCPQARLASVGAGWHAPGKWVRLARARNGFVWRGREMGSFGAGAKWVRLARAPNGFVWRRCESGARALPLRSFVLFPTTLPIVASFGNDRRREAGATRWFRVHSRRDRSDCQRADRGAGPHIESIVIGAARPAIPGAGDEMDGGLPQVAHGAVGVGPRPKGARL